MSWFKRKSIRNPYTDEEVLQDYTESDLQRAKDRGDWAEVCHIAMGARDEFVRRHAQYQINIRAIGVVPRETGTNKDWIQTNKYPRGL